MIGDSSLYVGSVMHRRRRPRAHHFRYRAFWMLLDLDELNALNRRLRFFSYNRANMFCLRDEDHGDGSGTPLRQQVERVLAQAGVDLAEKRIFLLCMPRTAGYVFNPLSIFFCRGADGTLAAVVYQVHNTFGERHSYVFAFEAGRTHVNQCRKRFFVSPFLSMDMRYHFRLAGPDERILVAISVHDGPQSVLHAVLAGERRALSDAALVRLFVQIPLLTLKVTAAIRWEALKLWLKRVRAHERPARPQHAATIIRAAAPGEEQDP